MTDAANDDADDGAEDGPIVLPPGARCANCQYSELIRMGQEIKMVRICRRFPPVPVIMSTPQGAVLTSTPPQVPDDYYCYEYDARSAPELIPTGLG